MGLKTAVQRTMRRVLGIQELSGQAFNWNGMVIGGGTQSSSGVMVTTDRALQVGAVFRAVTLLSEAIGAMPLHLFRDKANGGKEKATDEPLYHVLKTRPNRWQTAYEWRAMMEAHRFLRGNAYSRKMPGILGATTELIPLHPDRMRKVEMLTNGKLRYTYTNDIGRDEIYLQDEIFHLRGPSQDGIMGMSRISAARNCIGLSISTEQHGATLFKNGARPGVVFSSDQPIKVEAANQIRESWERMHGGNENQHKTAVLPYGLKPVELGLANNDAQFLETREFEVTDLARFLGIPPHKLYDLKRSTNNNIEHQGLEYVQDTLLPLVVSWEATILRDLIGYDLEDIAMGNMPTVYPKFNYDFYLRGDSTARAAFYRELFAVGGITPNIICDLEDFDPIGPDGDKRFVPMNMTTLEKAGTEPVVPATPPSPEPPPSDEPDDDEESPPADDRGLAVIQSAKAAMLAETSRLLRWEVDALNRLASKPSGFLGAVDEFYDKHELRHIERLAAMANIVRLSGGEIELEATVSGILDARRDQVVEAAGRATADQLKPMIESLTATWLPKGEEHDAAA